MFCAMAERRYGTFFPMESIIYTPDNTSDFMGIGRRWSVVMCLSKSAIPPLSLGIISQVPNPLGKVSPGLTSLLSVVYESEATYDDIRNRQVYLRKPNWSDTSTTCS